MAVGLGSGLLLTSILLASFGCIKTFDVITSITIKCEGWKRPFCGEYKPSENEPNKFQYNSFTITNSENGYCVKLRRGNLKYCSTEDDQEKVYLFIGNRKRLEHRLTMKFEKIDCGWEAHGRKRRQIGKYGQ